jgi:hypothetical protein
MHSPPDRGFQLLFQTGTVNVAGPPTPAWNRLTHGGNDAVCAHVKPVPAEIDAATATTPVINLRKRAGSVQTMCPRLAGILVRSALKARDMPTFFIREPTFIRRPEFPREAYSHTELPSATAGQSPDLKSKCS